MINKLKYHKNYIELGQTYQLVLQLSLEGLVPDDDSVRLLNFRAFGVLKNDYEFQRFLLRGKTKVKLEFLLLSLGYNINKLHAKIQNNRTEKPFL